MRRLVPNDQVFCRYGRLDSEPQPRSGATLPGTKPERVPGEATMSGWLPFVSAQSPARVTVVSGPGLHPHVDRTLTACFSRLVSPPRVTFWPKPSPCVLKL